MTRLLKRAFPKQKASAAIIQAYGKSTIVRGGPGLTYEKMWSLVQDLEKLDRNHPARKFCHLRSECQALDIGGCGICSLGKSIQKAFEAGEASGKS